MCRMVIVAVKVTGVVGTERNRSAKVIGQCAAQTSGVMSRPVVVSVSLNV